MAMSIGCRTRKAWRPGSQLPDQAEEVAVVRDGAIDVATDRRPEQWEPVFPRDQREAFALERFRAKACPGLDPGWKPFA